MLSVDLNDSIKVHGNFDTVMTEYALLAQSIMGSFRLSYDELAELTRGAIEITEGISEEKIDEMAKATAEKLSKLEGCKRKWRGRR